MDIATMAGAGSVMQEAQNGGEVGLKMLKKSNEMAETQAAQMLNSLPDPQSGPSSEGVGLKIDVKA